MCEEQRGGADVLLVLQSIVLHTGAGFYTDRLQSAQKTGAMQEVNVFEQIRSCSVHLNAMKDRVWRRKNKLWTLQSLN